MKADLLKAIQAKIDGFNDQDFSKVLKWSEFKEFVEEFKPKGKTIEERSKVFYDKVAKFTETYRGTMLKEFYDYWTERGDNDKKMRFEKQTSFSLTRRLVTWNKNQNKYGNGKSDTETRRDELNNF